MDERTMYELLEIHDAKNALLQVQELLSGSAYDAGYGEGIIGRLSYVDKIIARNSPLYDGKSDMESTRYGRLLEDRTIDNHKKARLLLGLDA